ncbi:pancreatic triacylglycerol lipase [Culicoides brevitarsis]|uniref:pancreatic triacylglycerol lipase n=1 Tax=Culicoides brevitarsis TaxID=469753 RepID=UPI00307B5304
MTFRQFYYFFAVCFIGNPAVIGFDPDYSIVNRLNHFLEASLNTVLAVSIGEPKSIDEEVTFWAATHENPNFTQIHINDTDIGEKLNTKLPVAFIIHGWFDSAHRNWVKNIASAFLEHTKTNVVAVDWNRLALQEYTLAADSTEEVGEQVAKFITKLNDLGIPLKNVTLVGHSMGAHISGFAGKHLGGKVGRIFGLDPAGPMFTKLTVRPESERLDPSDAEFVQVIHTDRTFIGTQIASGHQDFHPNDGMSPQPGCLLPVAQNAIHFNQFLCSHFKVVEYFRDALNPKTAYIGRTCNFGYMGYSIGLCNNTTSARFGIYTNETVRGTFYFRTPRIPPSFEQYLGLSKVTPANIFGR